MEQTTKTRKLADILDEAEQRSAALNGLSNLMSRHTEIAPRSIISPKSPKEEFNKVNDALDDYMSIFYASNSLAMISSDLLGIISEANMLVFDTDQMSDNVERLKKVKSIINGAFEAGHTHNGKEENMALLDQEMMLNAEKIVNLFAE